MEKKFLIVITNFRHGGTNKSLQNLTSIIDKKNIAIDVFALEHYGPYKNNLPNCKILKSHFWINSLIGSFNETRGIIKIFSLFIKVAGKFFGLFKIDIASCLFKWHADKLSNLNYDVAIAFSEGVPTRFVSFMSTSKKIAWVRCDYSRYLKLNNFPDESKTYLTFNRVICVSEFTRNEFCKHVPELNNKTHALHNVINTTFIKTQAEKNNAEPIEEKSFIILSIGRIDRVKRFSKIPEIIRILINNNCDIKWYLIGPSDGTAEHQNLEKNIKKYKVEEHIKWLGPKENPYPYMAKCDLVVTTSISEAAPNVINEAKILNKPIVCTNFGSASEFIQDGHNGFIVPIEKVADKIELLIKDKQLYKKIEANLSDFEYNNEKILKQFFDIFL